MAPSSGSRLAQVPESTPDSGAKDEGHQVHRGQEERNPGLASSKRAIHSRILAPTECLPLARVDRSAEALLHSTDDRELSGVQLTERQQKRSPGDTQSDAGQRE